MKTMKKVTALLLALMMVLSLAACGNSGKDDNGGNSDNNGSGGKDQPAAVDMTAQEVLDALKASVDLTVHHIAVDNGTLLPDQEVTLTVTESTRLDAARNHTCTHLLHAALRRVLGEHVRQAGSLVTPDRLRFDFSHIAPMTPEELAAVERDVNAAILADYPLSTKLMGQQDAIDMGAMALFGEKYGDTVRVVAIGNDDHTESVELCGGTHLRSTGQAGCFVILSESGIAAGARRHAAAPRRGP